MQQFQDGGACENNILNWGHLKDVSHSPDPIWDHVSSWISGKFVTFIFCDRMLDVRRKAADDSESE